MTTLTWRPEQNSLTTPVSYRARPVVRSTLGYPQVAAAISARNPTWTTELIESVLRQFREEVKIQISNGNRINLDNGFSFYPSLQVRLATPDSTMPPAGEVLQAQATCSRTFRDETAALTTLERLPSVEKSPVITSGVDVTTSLLDVVQSGRTLKLSGNDLLFDPSISGQACTITHPQESSVVQSNFSKIGPSEVLLVCELPDADNGEGVFQVQITTQYTENGSLRTGTYGRFIREPIDITIGPGSEKVFSNGGALAFSTMTADSGSGITRYRAQAVIDSQDLILRMSLLDMVEGGVVGDSVQVTGGGIFPVAITTDDGTIDATITVVDYTSLYTMVQQDYLGRCVDIFNVA